MTAGRLAFPARPPWSFSALPSACDLRRPPPVRRKDLRGPCLGFRDGRLPDRALPPWPLPPLRSLHLYPGRSPTVVNHRSSPAASPGIRRYAPPSTSFRVRARQRCRRRDVSGCHSRDSAALMVLHHLSGLPSPKVAGVLQPAADPGVRRVFERAALLPDESGGRARRHPRDAVRTPRRIPSSAAAPRHRGRCTSCGSTDLRAPPDRFRSRTETPDAPADPMGSGRPIARPTSTHPPGGLYGNRSHREFPSGIDRAPWCGRVQDPPPLRVRDTEPGSTGRSGPLQGLAPPTSSCRALRIGYRKRRQHGSSWASFPFKVLLPHPCGRDRRRHRRSGRGIELRSVVLSTRAVHAVTRTSRRQAWGAEDTGKPGSSTGHDPCEPCPPDAALAAPGTESLRGFTEATACAATRCSRSLSGAEVGEAGPSFTARFDPCGE